MVSIFVLLYTENNICAVNKVCTGEFRKFFGIVSGDSTTNDEVDGTVRMANVFGDFLDIKQLVKRSPVSENLLNAGVSQEVDGLVLVSDLVEGHMKSDGKTLAGDDERVHSFRIYVMVGCESAKDEGLSTGFYGLYDVCFHDLEFVGVIDEVTSAGTDHDGEKHLTIFEIIRSLGDDTVRWCGAASSQVITKLNPFDTGLDGSRDMSEIFGTKFSYNHSAIIAWWKFFVLK